MNDTQITKERIRHHFQYSWWKYVLLVVIAVFGWNMAYTMTRYQAPPDRRLGVYFVTHPVDAEALDVLREKILREIPGLEDVSCVSIVFSESDDYYGSIQLSTYIGAGEGDIYIMNRKQFSQYAPGGPFLALDAFVESGEIDTRGMGIESGYAVNEDSGERELYGIAAAELYGMMAYGIDNRDLVICVMAYSKNVDAAISCVDWLAQTMEGPKPDGIDRMEAETNGADQMEDYPSY